MALTRLRLDDVLVSAITVVLERPPSHPDKDYMTLRWTDADGPCADSDGYGVHASARGNNATVNNRGATHIGDYTETIIDRYPVILGAGLVAHHPHRDLVRPATGRDRSPCCGNFVRLEVNPGTHQFLEQTTSISTLRKLKLTRPNTTGLMPAFDLETTEYTALVDADVELVTLLPFRSQETTNIEYLDVNDEPLADAVPDSPPPTRSRTYPSAPKGSS